MNRKAFSIALSLVLSSCQTLLKHPGDSLAWRFIPTPPEIGKLTHALCGNVNGNFLAFGGIEEGADSALNNRLGIFEAAEGRWQIIEDQAEPEPRNLAALAMYDQLMILFGGETARKTETADAFVFDLNQKKWERLPESTLSPRKQASLTRIGNQLVVFGGRSQSPITDWASYTVQKKKWQVHDSGPVSRVSHIAIALSDSRLLIWGGFVGAERRADGFILSLDSNQIEPVPASPFLSPRANAKALKIGDEIYIWGGATRDGKANSGAIFNPDTKQWRGMPTIPDKRFDTLKGAEIALWNNSGFFLIGGRFGSEDFNSDLWFFNRANEEWSKIQTDPILPGRLAHCAITLTPRHLAVFGGIGYDKDSQSLTHSDGLWLLESRD